MVRKQVYGSRYITENEGVFLIAFSLYLFAELFENTAVFALQKESLMPIITKGVRYCAYFLLAVNVIRTSFKRHHFWLCMTAMAVLGLSVAFSTNRYMALSFLLMLGAYNVRDRIILKITALWQFVFLFFVVLSSQIGLTQDYIFGAGTERVRHGLGFSWATTAPILFFHFTMVCVVLLGRKYSFYHLLLFEGIGFLLFRMTDARMAFFLLTAMLVFFILQQKEIIVFRFADTIRDAIYIGSPFICCSISFAMAFFYKKGILWWDRINSILSGRLDLANRAIETYGISLLGKQVDFKGFGINATNIEQVTDYNYVDCSYVQIAILYGLLVLLLILFLYSFIIRRYLNINKYFVYGCLFLLVYGMTEPRLVNMAFNCFPLLLFATGEENGIEKELQINSVLVE